MQALGLLLLPFVFLIAVTAAAGTTADGGTGISDAALSVLDAHLGLVGTLDGVLHAISLDDGRELWQFDTGSPLVSSANHQSVEKLIPSSLDGSLFSFDSGARAWLCVRRHGMTHQCARVLRSARAPRH